MKSNRIEEDIVLCAKDLNLFGRETCILKKENRNKISSIAPDISIVSIQPTF